ncbi:MAG: HD domain-containing protein, partial [Zetaproteobacteria bacterium]|nr:HD domain-containing protein [Zetaproteobacteria bacterium]
MTNPSHIDIDLRQMIVAIETAVSLVGMNDTNHGKRVGFIAFQIGHQLGLDEKRLRFLYELGLLHDCGVSSEQVHNQLVNHFDWNDAHIHCEIGHQLLQDFQPLAAFATPILYHHTPWFELQTNDICAETARMANIIFLADRVDILSAAHYNTDILFAKDTIIQSLTKYSGNYFDPELVQSLQQVQQSESFWITLEDRHIERYAWSMAQISEPHFLTIDEIKQLALIMSYIVDQKSNFTAEHSVRVANVSAFLAKQFQITGIQYEKMIIAALLHDIGKLHTPDDILEKPGPLTAQERSVMNRHSFESYEILRYIKGMEDIALWAAYHHEGLKGGGYPFHPQEQHLSIEARIL